MESVLRVIFGTVLRSAVYKGMRGTGGVLLIVLVLVAVVGYAVVS